MSQVEQVELIEVVYCLCGLIGNFNCEGCEWLCVVFEVVDMYFCWLFMWLFEGGQVYFVLIDSDDFLEVGFEIFVQLLGKWLQLFMLLLGGEQVLIVVVLIFVLFFINLVLICVFDEVDVLFDDVNIECFCDLFDVMVGEIQICYLIVSYNVVMMSWMYCLFGVMMVECGVLCLVSVDFSVVEELLVVE